MPVRWTCVTLAEGRGLEVTEAQTTAYRSPLDAADGTWMVTLTGASSPGARSSLVRSSEIHEVSSLFARPSPNWNRPFSTVAAAG
jgi:hypothetical protein